MTGASECRDDLQQLARCAAGLSSELAADCAFTSKPRSLLLFVAAVNGCHAIGVFLQLPSLLQCIYKHPHRA